MGTVTMSKNHSFNAEPAQRVGLIGSASGWGAQIRGTEKGPFMVQERMPLESLQAQTISSYWTAMIHPTKRASEIHIPPGQQTLPFILPHLEKLASTVEGLIRNQVFPCAIGGDHVMAVGTFSGAIKALGARENFGLIWVDAHMDSHTPETSPSQAYHGMPVASLLGYGEDALRNLYGPGRKIDPRDLVLIGIRSFESEEQRLLESLGVKIYYCTEVLERGCEVVFKEAMAHVTKNTKAFGVSIDLDAFDPVFAPGVGSPEPDGMVPALTLPFLSLIAQHPQFAALEITELNPDLDRDHLTTQLVEDILKEILPR